MTEIAVTDAHALIWYSLKRWNRLGRTARGLYRAAESGRVAIYVPTIALVEILEAARRGQVRLRDGSSAWVETLFSSGNFLPADLTLDVVLRAEQLYAIPECRPVDRRHGGGTRQPAGQPRPRDWYGRRHRDRVVTRVQ